VFSSSRRFIVSDPTDLAEVRLEARVLRIEIIEIINTPAHVARSIASSPAQRINLAAVLTATRQEDGATFTRNCSTWGEDGLTL
jgi:hypothetical protein